MAIEKDRRDVRARQQVVEVVVRALQLVELALELRVHRVQLLVQRLELLLRGLQLLIGRLELLVDRHHLFVGRRELLVRGLHSRDGALQVLPGSLQLGFQLPYHGVVSLGHRCAGGFGRQPGLRFLVVSEGDEEQALGLTRKLDRLDGNPDAMPGAVAPDANGDRLRLAVGDHLAHQPPQPRL